MDNFKNTIIQEWSKYGFSEFKETIWSSSLQQADLSRIRRFLSQNHIKNVDVSIVIPHNNDTPRMRWTKYYERSGQCISKIREEFIPENSNNLKLTFCYCSKEEEQNNETQSIYVVNILRLVFGVPVARELILIRRFSNDSNDPSCESDKDFASMFDTQSLNMFNEPAIEKAKIIEVPVESTILLDKAFSQTYPVERFVLMWLAFEAIISAFPGDESNGDKRKKFFRDDLGSDAINKEVYRLFKLRCDLFKEGKVSESAIEKDCWSLYAVIQLAIMKNCEQRQELKSGYEKVLSLNALNVALK
ncbi:hypothetical protein [Thiomicrospira pelophila]|uniref:hypothetical protein n=1 Tax=Thiomicrospira pelophila TaxID=934 RepID=UPI0004A73475|nr:hypothetical protein [Thiomicrospira pelophila]